MTIDHKPGQAHVAISLGADTGVEAHADPVTFTYTVSVDHSAADHTPGALLFNFSSEPVADNAITWTAIAMAESGGASSTSGEDSRGLWQINVEPNDGNIQKGGWISDGTFEGLQGGTTVARETLTIAHEGYWLI
jgi:Lysozyme like domain